MEPNIIRSVLLGIALGAGMFAALFVWGEYDPWNTLAGHLAKRRLTPGERAELERLNLERRARDTLYHALSEQDQRERDEHAALVAAGFNPDLLNTPEQVHSPRDLDLAGLVAEIEHAEHSYRHADHTLLYPHREALFQEFTRRNGWQARARLSRTDQLRLDIAFDRVVTTRNQPFDDADAPITTAYGSYPHPGFTGPDPAGRGTEIEG
ncbi:hypothetical protein F3087_34090 [Nocardia colli]|uniref:Uncharacterized protein n=1 Tax=Nocardia colli TaxID=2545717 RepID=A0A5N0E5L2_9NOCA|nr:hypothetical protein [Nocardia colli]KAA8884256.1 hypothetical protein F3087_34090 [Nocardia colli]